MDFVSAERLATLIFWLGKDVTQADIDAVKIFGSTLIYMSAVSRILFVPPVYGKNFLPAAIRKGTHFITTREMVTLEALDYLWDTDVKIVSALDNGIF